MIGLEAAAVVVDDRRPAFDAEPLEFAVLVVRRRSRDGGAGLADHIVRVNAERRRYPDREAR